MLGTIMVVENEGFVLEAVEDILDSAGLKSIGVTSGKDSVEVFNRLHKEIDLVILDLHLPGMEGDEVLRLLRAINPNIKVIISSGYDEQDILRRLGNQKSVSILRKPYNAQTLLNRVHDELDNNSTIDLLIS